MIPDQGRLLCGLQKEMVASRQSHYDKMGVELNVFASSAKFKISMLVTPCK